MPLLVMLMFRASAQDDQVQRYAGGDISLLPEYEKASAIYKDHDGKPIASLLPWLYDQGMNAMRVRLFVNPSRYKELHQNDNGETRYDPNACQDLEYIRPLCKRIVDQGFALMLDFHYSDTWADPAKQWTPVDWEGLDDDALVDTIYSYTKNVLLALKADGVTPTFIQPGNEISYGMLWGPVGTTTPKKALMGSDANWARFGRLLQSAIRACHEVCSQAKIILHTERVAQVDVLKNFYDKMKSMNVNYDIIGLSYYPYFHGDMSVLSSALSTMQTRYPDKDIMIVETGYSYKWAVPGTEHDFSGKWPYSDAGQALFATALVNTLKQYDKVTGLFWWWMEYNAFNTTLSGWYNAPLFDSTTGRATKALGIIAGFATKHKGVAWIPDDPAENKVWYDLRGRKYEDKLSSRGFYIHKGKIELIY